MLKISYYIFLKFLISSGVRLYDGSSFNAKLLLSISGCSNPAPVLPSTPQMLISTFTTDLNSFSNYSGFLATYSNGDLENCVFLKINVIVQAHIYLFDHILQ